MEVLASSNNKSSLQNNGTMLLSWELISMNEIKSINQSILEIVFDWTYSNALYRMTIWRFGISKYDQYSVFGNTFQCH